MRLRLLVAAALLVLAGCDEEASTEPPTLGGPLIPGTWYMHAADGDTLPAEISVRPTGVAQEKTIIDSSQLVIRSDLTYSQRYWARVLLNEVLDRREVIIDEGTFATEHTGFRLSSSLRTREFTMFVPTLGTLNTSEQMVFFEVDPPITSGTYRLTRP
jgi:hypothetical protein